MTLKHRPFAAIGFTALLSLFLIFYFSELFAPIVISAGILLVVISLLFKSVRERIVPIYLAVALIFSGLMYYSEQSKVVSVREFYDKTAYISGVVIEKDEGGDNDRYYYVLDLYEIDGKAVDSKLKLSSPVALSADYADIVSMNANIYEISAGNKGIKLNYYSDGIYLGAYIKDDKNLNLRIEPGNPSAIEKFVLNTRETIKRNVVDNISGETGATVLGMLLGDKSGLSDDRNESFREVGVAPIFAVSGMHLSIWVLGLFSILKSFGVRKRLNSIIAVLFTVFFMFLTGLTPSVCRAGIMMIVLLCGNLFHRKADSVNSLGLVAFIMCAINPFIAVDTGFILSFSATLGIVTLVPLSEKHIFSKLPDNLFGKMIHKLILPIVVSVSASIAVLPATILLIGRVSVLSVISNVALNYVAMVSMITGGIGSLAAAVPLLNEVCFGFSSAFAKVLLMVVDEMRNWPFTVISTENIFWKIAAIASLAIVIFAVFNFKGKNIFRLACVGLAVNIVAFSLSSYFYYYDLTQVRILNVDGGICVVAYSGGSKIVITGKSDSYDKIYGVSEALDYYNLNDPDLLLIADSGALSDSSNFILMKDYNFNRIVLPDSNHSLESFILKDRLFAEPKATIEIFDDDKIQYMSSKSFSLAHCTFNDIEILFLFSSTKKADIPSEYLDADYLVCCGYIPSCINPALYSEVIVCGNNKNSEAIVNYVNSYGADTLSMGDYKAVLFNIRENSHKIISLEE